MHSNTETFTARLQSAIAKEQRLSLASVIYLFILQNGNPGKTVDDPRHLAPSVLRVLNPP